MSAHDAATQHWAGARDALASGDSALATREAVAARRAEAEARGHPFNQVFGNPEGETPRVRAVLRIANDTLEGVPDDRWGELKQEIAFSCLLGTHPDEAPTVALFGTRFRWPQLERERRAFQEAGDPPCLWEGLGDPSHEPGAAAKAVFDKFASLSYDARRILVHNAALGREVVRPFDDAQRRCYLGRARFAAGLRELEACDMAATQLTARQELMLLTVRELQSQAQGLGLPKSGRKADLATRIADHGPDAVTARLHQNHRPNHIWLLLDIPTAAKAAVSQHRRLLALVGHHLLFQASSTSRAAQSAELGTDLVQLDIHDNACSLCQKVQGKVFSLSGASQDFPRLTEAATPPLHIGCGHILLPVVEHFMEQDAPRDAQAALSRSDRPVRSHGDWLQALVECGAPAAIAAGRDAEVTAKLREDLEQLGLQLGASVSWEWAEQQYYVFLSVPYGDNWSRRFAAPLVHAWLDGGTDKLWQEVSAAAVRLGQAPPATQIRLDGPPQALRPSSPVANASKPAGCLLAAATLLANALRSLRPPPT